MAYNILSLDGGGTWALIQARILMHKYGSSAKGHDILRDYHLAIANSGGSLVLSMLCADKSMQQIVDTFNNTDVLQSIFDPKLAHYIPELKRVVPNYHTTNKYSVFRQHLRNGDVEYGDKLICELPGIINGKCPDTIGRKCPDIIITAFDYDRQRAIYFRSNRQSRMESSYIEKQTEVPPTENPPYDKFKSVTLAQAVHASSNAPVQFFDDPAAFKIVTIDDKGTKATSEKDRLFWDGAVGGNNNPVKVGVLEALANWDLEPRSNSRAERRNEINVVSIGTSSTIQPVLYDEKDEPLSQYEWLTRSSRIDGMVDDIERISTSILSDPPDAASFDAHQVLDLPFQQKDQRFIRINPLIKPMLVDTSDGKKMWCIPGAEGKWSAQETYDLFTLDMAVATSYGVKLINRLCDDFIAGYFDNQGIRIGGKKMEAILGHKNFRDALTDWDKVIPCKKRDC
jgi:hypothetical protein